MIKITKLKQTTKLMNSDKPEERLVAEIIQLEIRMAGIERAIANYNKETFNCSRALLRQQLTAMRHYHSVLISRAERFEINLNDYR